MTPLHLGILLHHYANPSPYPHRSMAADEYAEDLAKWGMMVHKDADEFCMRVTPKGVAWLERVLETPMPVQRWVWDE